MRWMLVAAMLAVASAARAERVPLAVTAAEVTLLVAAQAALTIDMAQTMRMQRLGLYEHNSILGRRPGDAKIALYFGACSLATTAAWALLPPGWRSIVPAGVLLVELPVIARNHDPAIGFGFRF